MREHMGLYRGKRIDNGEWVEGCLLVERYRNVEEFGNFEKCTISVTEDKSRPWHTALYEVDPDTVGECTGLRDKNGKLIFEGDVVRMPHEHMETERINGCFGYDSEGYPQRIPGYVGSGEYPVVKRGFKNCPVKFNPNTGFYAGGTSFSLSGIDVEIIGNIHDNPELLKGGAKMDLEG